MVPELEKARVTELHVRMDCRGCVQKIKRALHSLDGVYSMNIDLASQKLTVVSTAEPEAILKVIKKARKFATVCSPTEPAGEAAGGAAEPAAPPPAEPPANQPPAEAETPPKEEAPPSQGQDESTKAAAPAEAVPGESKEVAEIIPVVHHYPYDRASNYYYYYNDHCYPCPRRYEPPDYAYSGYSHYRTSPYALPQRVRFIQDAAGAGDDYSYGGNYRRGGGGEVCVFSEDNPNACTIV